MQFLLIFFVFTLGIFATALFFYHLRVKDKTRLNELNKELSRKKYEALVLAELEDRIGASLDNIKIGEIIVGSLSKVIDYHSASYLLLNENNQLVFKCLVKESVNHRFIIDVKKRMLASFGSILDSDLSNAPLEENITGVVLDENITDPVGSFFNIPLYISHQPVGVITVASPKKDLYTSDETAILYAMAKRASLIATRMQEIMKRERIAQEQRRLEAERRAYQAEVLRELGERIGYFLDDVKIIEIITGSLGRLLPYHTISSMVKRNRRIVFKTIIESAVNRSFVRQVKEIMLTAFAEMTNEKLNNDIDESVTGALFDESIKDPVRSFFNLPLVINEKVAGLITVASPKSGLYTEEETNILYTITELASTAVSKLNQVLESEKGKLESLVENLADGAIMIDSAWNLLLINPKAQQFLELDKTTTTMLDVLESLAGKIDLRTKIEEAVKMQTAVSTPEFTLGKRTLKIIAIAVNSQEGAHLGTVVTLHDVSQEKELEALRDQFQAMMIHELRSPLNNIRATTVNMLRDLKTLPADELNKSLSIIRNQAVDMLELVNDLLDVAKLEAGKFTVTKERVDLQALIDEVVARFKENAQEKNLTLEAQFNGDLTNVPADGFRLRQVVANLLSNAIKFTEQGMVKIYAGKDNSHVKVTVSDTGIGIAKEQLDKLFTKFYQLKEGARKKDGTGLGLVIARGIVEVHGGQIWADSTPGEGSSFTFTLPL